MRTIIAIDGHDGTGKTTLCRELALHLPAAVARPFAGATGKLLEEMAMAGDWPEYSRVAVEARNAATAEAALDEYLIFDRHWMTVFSLVPAEYRSAWLPLPLTFHLTADLAVVEARLREPGHEFPTFPSHRRFLAKYSALAAEFGAMTIDTSTASIDHCLAQILQHVPRPTS